MRARADGRSLLSVGDGRRDYLPLAGVVGLLVVISVAFAGSRYLLSVATMAVVLACYGIGFNLIFGGTAQLLLSVGAVAAVTAYSSALLGELAHLPVAVTLPVGVLAGTALGTLLSWIGVRRRLTTIFVGVVSLTASLVVQNLLLGGRELTGGETGLLVEGGAGTPLREPLVGFYLLVAVLAVGLVGHQAIQRSSLAWACRAVRDDGDAAQLAGIDVAKAKVTVAAIGSAFIALAGGLYAHVDGFISPTTYAFSTVDIRAIMVVMLGGVGTVTGPVVGAVVVTGLDEFLRPLGQLRMAVYGALLLVIFLGLSDGLVPTLSRLVGRRRTRSQPARHERVQGPT